MFNLRKEIESVKKLRVKSQLDAYEHVSNTCFEQIKIDNKKYKNYTIFRVPSIMPGYKYNVDKCVEHVMKKIKDQGINCKRVDYHWIYISWKNIKPQEINSQSRHIDQISFDHKDISVLTKRMI